MLMLPTMGHSEWQNPIDLEWVSILTAARSCLASLDLESEQKNIRLATRESDHHNEGGY